MGVVIGALPRLATPKPGWTVMGKPTTAVMPPRGLSKSDRGQKSPCLLWLRVRGAAWWCSRDYKGHSHEFMNDSQVAAQPWSIDPQLGTW